MATEIKFESVEIPATVVERKPNAFQPLIDDLVANGGARAFTLPNKSADDAKAVESAIGHIQRTARAAGVSARKKVVTEGDKATITVWLVEKITRNREGGDAAKS